MTAKNDRKNLVLNYNPLQPDPRFCQTTTTAMDARAAMPLPDPGDMPLSIGSSSELLTAVLPTSGVAADTIAQLKPELAAANVSYASSTVESQWLRFTDTLNNRRPCIAGQASNDDAESFRGSYFVEGDRLVTRREFVSSYAAMPRIPAVVVWRASILEN
jgi:hypothetical protein